MANDVLSLSAKLERWEKSLSPDKVALIAYAIKMEMENLEKNINYNIDNCFTAAIDDYTNLSIKEIKQIINRTYEYMSETEKYIKENGVGWMNKIEKCKEGLREFLKNEMSAGVLKSEAILKAKHKFDIPATDISNLWIEIKEQGFPELCKDERSAKVYEKKRNSIKCENKAHTEENEDKGKIIRQEEEKGSDKTREAQKDEIKTSLKEITNIREFQGEYGKYMKYKDGDVKTEELTFSNADDVENYKKQIDKELEEERKEFEKQQEEKRLKAIGKLNEVMELLSM